ncbi:MAG: DUF4159 domain-containing protein [Verrucomicrobia bacterium]|nr:DUF4159 domain-containing protein [Verrucomicrobiota bacterium]
MFSRGQIRTARAWLRRHARRPVVRTAAYAVLWCLLWIDAHAWFLLRPGTQAIGFLTALPVCYYWIHRWRHGSLLIRRAILSISYLPLWQLLSHLPLLFSAYALAATITMLGTLGAFFLGLGWAVWWIDRETKRATPADTRKRIWDPRQLVAWYFGRKSRKLHQSLFTVLTYTCLFGTMALILTRLSGCSIYEAPVGGGEEKQLKQIVKIQTVINKKYVINPYSSILFNPPPIDDVKLEVLEVTEHLYKIGQGKGEGAGFSAGTTRGKVRFIRLKYDGGDWFQDMDRGADLNLLTEYGVRLGHPVNDRPEPMEISRLKAFPARKSPPMVYMTGQQNINVGEGDIKILREYLLEKHGMLFGDNGGSSGWEGQFVSMMQRVLPKIEPISVYLDHPIHRIPYPLPKLPIVAPHGRSSALGWVVDGRLVAYYHPGDIGDAWADGHSGVPHDVWESSYQLGVNIIYYAHAEYNKWLEATKK